MEFLDEDTRPRFTLQSGAPTSSATQPQPLEKPSKPFLFITLSLSTLLFALSIFFLQSEPFRSLLFWLSLSLLIGPFAPLPLTGGHARVGHGPIVEFPNQDITTDDEAKKRASQKKRSKTRRSEEVAVGPVAVVEKGFVSEREGKNDGNGNGNGNGVVVKEEEEEEEEEGEKEWSEEEIEVLRKQMLKHPVGKPRRWEVIAEAFRGRHKVESVIKKAKELGEKKIDDSDSYAQFLKKRKPVDKRVENNGDDDLVPVENGPGTGWSSGEDIALLNALKAFPKDVSMRWEKIAAAVPGKSKAACMKRVTELKKGFRSAKAAADG